MNLQLSLLSKEELWNEGVRRRELFRVCNTLSRLTENIQLTEDYASNTPKKLAILINATADTLLPLIPEKIPSFALNSVYTFLGEIIEHVRFIERAKVSQIPWSVVQSAERLFKRITSNNNHFFVRPCWSYSYSIRGDFISTYINILSTWPWFPLDIWKVKLNFNIDDSIYCVSFPRIERLNGLLHVNWGHEIGHILVSKWILDEFSVAWSKEEPRIGRLIKKFVMDDIPPLGTKSPFYKRLINQHAANLLKSTKECAKFGFQELLCDRVGIHLFGFSAVAALMEYSIKFDLDASPLEISYYPPWRFRLRNMFRYCLSELNKDEDINDHLKGFIKWLKEGQQIMEKESDLKLINLDIVTREAYNFINKYWDAASDGIIKSLPSEFSRPYHFFDHQEMIVNLINRFIQGIPPNEISHFSKPANYQDILSSAWAYKLDKISQNPNWGMDKDIDEYGQLFRLVLKGIESSYIQSELGPEIIRRENEHSI